MINNYNDIINLSRPVSKRPKMSLEQRSAQFAPFAALTGYDGQVKETARLTNRKIEIDEEQKLELNFKIQLIQSKIKEQPQIEITYFVPDTNFSKYLIWLFNEYRYKCAIKTLPPCFSYLF